jgi:cytochrome c oxidase subunit 2
MAFRFREKKNQAPPVQVHGNTKIEIGWTLAPALILAALAVPTVATIFSLATPARGADVVHITVTGHRWWWEYEYTDAKPSFRTATEMVIPVGRPVDLRITAIDVIHSFWIPKLAGKQDAIPNRNAPLTIQADKPGTYWGQCAEYCGLSHANMRLRVVAMTSADYDAWFRNQQQDANIGSLQGLAAQGAQDFATFKTATGACIACHTLRGIPAAQGQVGPDLTHLASRSVFAGAIMELNAANLEAWLHDPPGIKPGSVMPNYHIPADTIQALVAFLLTLK